MIKKVIFIIGQAALTAGVSGLATQNLCMAQATVITDEGRVTPAPVRYRDGARWVDVTRLGPDPTREDLQRVALRVEGHRYSAHVGQTAILQLAKDVPRQALLRAQGLRLVRSLSVRLRIYAVQGRPGEDGLDVAARLQSLPGVVSAVPDYYVAREGTAISVPPNDPRLTAQWYLDYLNIEQAWQLSTGAEETTIVVVDNGCDMQHPDLTPALQGGLDLVDDDDDPSYEPGIRGNAHGTACAGIAAGRGDNGIGIAGLCPTCSLRCVRLYSAAEDRADNGRTVQLAPFSADVAAFDYAFEVGAAVVSNSWGFANPIPAPAPLRAAIESLHQDGRDGRGAVIVFAAGNEGRTLGDDELVGIDGVLNVGAVNQFDEAAPFSNSGASLDLAAPTGSFTTDITGPDGDDPGDYTSLFGGTSAACPVVAGIAGLLLSADPSLTATEADALLLRTVRPAPFAVPDDQGHDPTYGYGIVDPVAALTELLGPPGDPADAGPDEPPGDAASSPADAGSAPDQGQSASGGCATTGRAPNRAGGWLALLPLGLLRRRARR